MGRTGVDRNITAWGRGAAEEADGNGKRGRGRVATGEGNSGGEIRLPQAGQGWRPLQRF